MARLTADRIVEAAIALTDEIGFNKLTIRRLADTLSVKPMTIYHHLPNKDAIIDSMVDRVFAEIELPPADLEWREAISVRTHSLRQVLGRHSWAVSLLDSRRSAGPSVLRHHDAVIGCLRTAGFPMPLIGHTTAVLDSYVYGFVVQEAALPATEGDEMAELAAEVMKSIDPAEYPHFVEFAMEQVVGGTYDFGDEFDVGLEMILDAIDTKLSHRPASP